METNKAASHSCVFVEYILRWCGCISRFVWIYYRCKARFIQSFFMPFVDGEAFQYNLGSWFVYPLFLIGGCLLNLKLWIYFWRSLCRMLGSGVDLASEVGSEQGNQVVHGFQTFLLSSQFTPSSSRRSA